MILTRMVSVSCFVQHTIPITTRLNILQHACSQPSYSVFTPRSHIQSLAHSRVHYQTFTTQQTAFTSLRSFQTAAHAVRHQQSTSSSPSTLHIQPGEVHLWWLNHITLSSSNASQQSSILERCRELLPPDELEDCHASSSSDLIQERMIARGFLRSVLSQYLLNTKGNDSPSAPSALVFTRNQHGKPDMASPTHTHHGHHLRFNLTHTKGMVGVAVTVDALVGLDVESKERQTKRQPMKLAARRFSDLEYQALLRDEGDVAVQARHFMQLWTLKESYVKAVGRGISAAPGLKGFSFSINNDSDNDENLSPIASRQAGHVTLTMASSSSDEGKQWQFALLEPSMQHIAALCVERHNNSPVDITSYSCSDIHVNHHQGGSEVIQTAITAQGIYP